MSYRAKNGYFIKCSKNRIRFPEESYLILNFLKMLNRLNKKHEYAS